MHDVNKSILVGNLTRDPEISGPERVRFEVVTSRRHLDGTEDKTFHAVICENKRAEFARRVLVKGTRVYVEGYVRRVENRYEVVASDISPFNPVLGPTTPPLYSDAGVILRPAVGDTFSDLQ